MHIEIENNIKVLVPDTGMCLVDREDFEKPEDERYYFNVAYLPPSATLEELELKYAEVPKDTPGHSPIIDIDSIAERIVGGVTSVNGAYIDTGLTLDGSYTFEATGYTLEGKQSVLVGAFTSTSLRTTLRMLGVKHSLQASWPYNNEMGYDLTGISCREMFTYRISASSLYLQQGNLIFAKSLDKSSNTQQSSAPILLFNETPNGDFNNGVLSEAKIWDSRNALLRHFQAYRLYEGNEYVMVDRANNDKIYRPVKGSFTEAGQQIV